MRTAVRKEITSFGTFLSTLCHEFCHHLDFQRFRFPDSWHTRAFTSELLIDLDRAPQLPDGLRVDAYVLTNGPSDVIQSQRARCDTVERNSVTRFMSLYTVPKRAHFGVIRLAMRVTLEGTSTAYASASCSKTILEILRLRLQYQPAARLSAPAFSSSFPSLWAPLYAYLPSMRTRPDPRWCRTDRPKTCPSRDLCW